MSALTECQACKDSAGESVEAEYLAAQSSDEGKIVSWVLICSGHAQGWNDGGDWVAPCIPLASVPLMVQALKDAHSIILEMGGVIRDLDRNDDHNELWTHDSDKATGSPVYVMYDPTVKVLDELEVAEKLAALT